MRSVPRFSSGAVAEGRSQRAQESLCTEAEDTKSLEDATKQRS
jgi:hypothetical protein